ncbi:MAG TPA: hypothetical protein ENK33_05355 [Desulfobacterales bacterium]|nr:hypothetical protein [Desulfobacterales bacterium]
MGASGCGKSSASAGNTAMGGMMNKDDMPMNQKGKMKNKDDMPMQKDGTMMNKDDMPMQKNGTMMNKAGMPKQDGTDKPAAGGDN